MNKSYYAIIPATVRYDKDLTPNAKLLYGEITALCNEKGFCWATNQYFAELYNVSKMSISNWIKQLTHKGYISTEIIYKEGTKEILHRYIRILGEGSKDILDTPTQDILDTPTQKNLKDNNTGFNNTVINNKKNNTSDKKNMLESEFELLWKSYPRKQGKAKAFKSYEKARKNDSVSYERVQKGIDNYIRYIEIHRVGEEYVKHGSTWFGNECWEEEYNLKRDSIKGERSGFLGLYLNELDNRADILEYQGGGQYDERGNYEVISDNPLFFSEPLQKF
jgi:hypothetical protein